MWPFNKKKAEPVVCTSSEVVEPVVSDEHLDQINEVCHDLNQAQIDQNMVEYLKTRGFDVTPSGTPIGLVHRVTTTVTETAVDTFHVARGLGRTLGNVARDNIARPVKDKIHNLKELGS